MTSPNTDPVRESVFVETTAKRAYDAVSDVTRMGEWSPENTGAVLLGGTAVVPGTRFRGTNRSGWFRWSTQCEVTLAEPGKVFSFDVRALGVPVSGWTYEFAEADGGTWISETWTDRRGTGPRAVLLRWIARTFIRTPDRVAHNREMIRATLRALKHHLESDRTG